MSSLSAIVRVTVRQLTGRARTIGFALLALIPAGLLYAASRGRDVGLDTDFGALVVSPFLAFVVPITSLILAGAALGDERRDKTLSFLVLRPVSRLRIVVAKTAAAVGVAVGFTLFGTLAMALVYGAVGGAFALAVAGAVAVGASIAAILYASLFTALGNIVSRPTVVGLLFVVFVENVLIDEVPRLAPLSPWRVGLAATIDLAPEGFPARALLGAIGVLDPSVVSSLMATVGVVAVALAAGNWRLSQTDAV